MAGWRFCRPGLFLHRKRQYLRLSRMSVLKTSNAWRHVRWPVFCLSCVWLMTGSMTGLAEAQTGREQDATGQAPVSLTDLGRFNEDIPDAPQTELVTPDGEDTASADNQTEASNVSAAVEAASPAPSLKPSAAHGQTDRPSREAATDGIGDQPWPQWAFSSDESTHQLSSIAQVHAMAAGCFHRLSAQPHRDAPPRAQSFPRP